MRSHSYKIGWLPIRSPVPAISLVHSHWSRNVEAWLSLVESFKVSKYFHGVATPALLCHKEPAQGMQNAPDVGGILCLLLVL